jgi:outer membrane receptor for ferrienterochelin and colicin
MVGMKTKPSQLIAATLCLGWGCWVLADEEIDDLFSMSPAELADIQVTIATGTAKPVYRSAAVTSVITAEQIRAMGATELHEVLDTVPGLHVSIQPVTNEYIFTMRGIANSTNSEVLVMMNGTRYTEPYKGSHMTGMQIPLQAVQRIEVIRGPGSALYGADAFAGVINIITKKAEDIDGTVVGVRGGSFDTQSVWGLHGGQWQGWNVAATLQYNHNNADNDRIIDADAQSTLDRTLSTNASLAPGVMQTQAERWNAHLNLQRKYVDVSLWAFSNTDAGLKAGAGGALDNRGSFDGESYLADLRFSSEDLLDDWELQAHLSYMSNEINADIYNFPAGTVLPIGADGNLNLSSTSFVAFPDGMRTQVSIGHKIPIAEFNTLYKGWEDHLIRFSAGYRYEEVNTGESRNYGVGVIDGGSLPPFSSAGGLVNVTGTDLIFLQNQHRDIWSFVLQDEWQFAKDWQLTAGLRYDEYSDFGSTFNPRVALVWDVSEQLTTKLLYGQAYRAPSFLEQFQQNSQLFIGNPGLEPQEIETIELAFDYRPMSTLRTALNVFYYEISDQIATESSFVSTSTVTVENSKGQHGYGTEFEWDWQFHEDWSFRGNYSWQYSRNEELKKRVANVPEHKLYTGLAWHFMPKWQLQTQLNWVGHRVKPVNDDRDTLADYETLDITLNGNKLFGYVDVRASVRNLFDSNGKEPSIRAYDENMPIPGQSFYFEASIKF